MKKDYKKPNTTIFNVDVTAMMATSPGGGNTVTGGGSEEGGSDNDLGEGARESVMNDLW